MASDPPGSTTVSLARRWQVLPVVLAVIYSSRFFHIWSDQGFIASLIDALTGLVALAVMGGTIIAVETRLSGRARWWGRIAELSAAIGILLLTVSWAGGLVNVLMAGTLWAALTGTLVILMRMRPDLTS